MAMGRPIKNHPLNDEQLQTLKNLAHIQCTWSEIAACMNMPQEWLEKTYGAVYKAGIEGGKMSLKRQMWRKAMEGNNTSMQIFLSKNLLGYSDNNRISADITTTETKYTKQYDSLVTWLCNLDKKAKE